MKRQGIRMNMRLTIGLVVLTIACVSISGVLSAGGHAESSRSIQVILKEKALLTANLACASETADILCMNCCYMRNLASEFNYHANENQCTCKEPDGELTFEWSTAASDFCIKKIQDGQFGPESKPLDERCKECCRTYTMRAAIVSGQCMCAIGHI